MPTLIKVCPLCQQAGGKCRRFTTVRGWNYVGCPRCSLVFLNPRPTREELAIFYNQYYVYDRERYRRTVEQQKSWLQLLERFSKKGGKLLEVGCSYGYFLAAARDYGWQVEGIELSAEAASFARQRLRLPIIQGTLSDRRKEIFGLYDVVVAWHLLEHEIDPFKFLKEAYDILCPGGILALRVPNLDSAVAELAGACWQWLSPPEHIYMFSARTLCSFLTSSRFQVLLTQTARGNARNMWFEVLRARTKLLLLRTTHQGHNREEPSNFSRPPVYENRLWYRAVEQVMDLGSKPIDWFLSPWLAKRGREAELSVVAQKPISESNSAH